MNRGDDMVPPTHISSGYTRQALSTVLNVLKAMDHRVNSRGTEKPEAGRPAETEETEICSS